MEKESSTKVIQQKEWKMIDRLLQLNVPEVDFVSYFHELVEAF